MDHQVSGIKALIKAVFSQRESFRAVSAASAAGAARFARTLAFVVVVRPLQTLDSTYCS